MKIPFVILLIFAANISFANSKIFQPKNDTIVLDTFYGFKKIKIIHSETEYCIQTIADTIVVESCDYLNGEKNGIQISKNLEPCIDKNGKMHSRTHLIYLTNFKNGKANGKGYTYDIYSWENRVVLEESYKDDKLDGFSYRYFNDGKIMSIAFYINGKLNGGVSSFNQVGELLMIRNYNNDTITHQVEFKNNKIISEEKLNRYCPTYDEWSR